MKRLIYILIVAGLILSCEDPDSSKNAVYQNSRNDATFDNYSFNASMYSAENGGYEGSEQYNEIEENPFIKTEDNNISTFSIDADGASYSNARRFINQGTKPPKDAIRTEEMVNFFNYYYDEPETGQSISVNTELIVCPWQAKHCLLRIGLKGKTINKKDLPPTNIVLLVDVSGSMSSSGKLDLLKESFELLINNLREQDRIAIVTYAGNAGVALESVSGDQKFTILNVIKSLESGGSTAGAEGINTAYSIAADNFIENGNNRVILATDGDFNVGPSSQEELIELIKEKRESGIYLTILGVGTGNLNDALMEQTANNGNGTYEYIDSYKQAEKVFDHEYGKFYSVAKDAKIQVVFSNEVVESYRLIGYENRLMENEDFEDDSKDAGEIGSGQTITALYEIVIKDSEVNNMAAVLLKYKMPLNNEIKTIENKVKSKYKLFKEASDDTRFAACVAAFSLKLRDSEYKGESSFDDIIQWSESSKGNDPFGYKSEFSDLVYKYTLIEE